MHWYGAMVTAGSLDVVPISTDRRFCRVQRTLKRNGVTFSRSRGWKDPLLR